MSPDRTRRRLLLGTAAGAVLAAPARSQAPAAARVAWQDVALIDGRSLPASALAAQAVVVEIWATWCPFCARQNPYLQRLHEATQGKGLQVLTFSIDARADDVRGYLKKHGYTFPVAMATPQVETWFGRRRALPELYVVDRNGRIVQHESGEMFPEDIAALARWAAPSNVTGR